MGSKWGPGSFQNTPDREIDQNTSDFQYLRRISKLEIGRYLVELYNRG